MGLKRRVKSKGHNKPTSENASRPNPVAAATPRATDKPSEPSCKHIFTVNFTQETTSEIRTSTKRQWTGIHTSTAKHYSCSTVSLYQIKPLSTCFCVH